MTTAAKLAAWAASPAVFVSDLAIPTRQGPQRWGDVMTSFQREWLDAMAPSFLAVAAGEAPPTPKFWIEASKNCSKTTLVAALILWLLIFRRKPGNGVAGAVDKDNAAEVLLAAKELLAENSHLAERVEIQAWAIVGRQTDCVVEIVATDRKGSQGGRPMLTYVDECSHVDDQSFEFVRNVLDDASKTGGLTIVTSNAGWTRTAAYDLREIARTSPRWGFLRWAQPSPLTPAEELEESRLRNTSARHKRLHYTEWADGGGDAIEQADILACLTRKGPIYDPETECSYFIGLDLSTKRDRSAAVVVGANPRAKKVHLAVAQSWAPVAGGMVDLVSVRETVQTLARRFSAAVHYDPHQAGLLVQELQAAGVRCAEMTFSAANLSLMATTIMQAFRQKQIELYNDPQLLADVAKLSIEERGFSHCKLVAPSDRETGHADTAMALAIALPAAIAAASREPTDYMIDSLIMGGVQSRGWAISRDPWRGFY